MKIPDYSKKHKGCDIGTKDEDVRFPEKINVMFLGDDGQLWYADNYVNYLLQDKDKEIERLNNIINEFDKWLLGEQMMFYKGSDDERLIRYGETKNKWLEFKGVDKE